MIKKCHKGFPGGAVVKYPPANAGDTGLSPGLGRSHMPGSNWAREPTITEPARLEPVLCNKRGRDSEGPAHCDEEWPTLATTREGPRTETKTQHSHKERKKERNVTRQWLTPASLFFPFENP